MSTLLTALAARLARPLRPRPRRRGWTGRVAWPAFAAVLALLAAFAAPAYAATGSVAAPLRGSAPAAPALGAPAPLPQDLSGALPVLHYNEAAGYFTGDGHEQLAYGKRDVSAKTSELDIADVSKYGGEVKSVPSDLFNNFVWLPGVQLPDRFQYAPRVAADSSNIYMAGVRVSGSTLVSTLYKLPHDGSCAQASCAIRSVDLPGGSTTLPLASLAVGTIGGQTLIAVSLETQSAVLIYNDDLDLVATLTDPAGSKDSLISMAFSPPSGPGEGGWLAGTNLSFSGPDGAVGWVLDPDGTSKSDWVYPVGVSYATTFASLGGRMTAVVARGDGDVIAINPDTGKLIADLPVAERSGVPVGVTALTPWDGNSGDQELVVGMKDGTGDKVLSDVNNTLTAVPFTADGGTTGTDDQVYAWYPGYGGGRLQVVDRTPVPVTIAMASRPDPNYGCWLNAAVAGGPAAFPTSDTPLASDATSPAYFAGALTAGLKAECASDKGAGERNAYVIITPAGDRADEHIVKLVAGADGTLRVGSQVGGYLTATVTRASTAPGSWGTWVLNVNGGGSATPLLLGQPALHGFRLTAAPGPDYVPPTSPQADDPARPVYRFDVSGFTFDRVAVPGQVTAQIPALTVQGRTGPTQPWQDLGQLMPSAAPVSKGDPNNPTVTLGASSFYWQDAPHAAPLTEVRVTYESNGRAVGGTAIVRLASLPAPPANGGADATPVDGIQATPDAAGGIAAPRANGVDQATVTDKLIPSSGGTVPATDPRYNLVYYRMDGTNALVTGLYQPGDYTGYVAVGPYGADGATHPARSYLTTTGTSPQNLDAVMNDTGTVSAYTSGAFGVSASQTPLTPVATSASGGISISGCASANQVCPLTAPTDTAPALYQAGSAAAGPVTGLQLRVSAITGRGSLPLDVGSANVHQLGSAPLVVSTSQAKLVDTSGFFPSDTIDTALVTSGRLVTILSVPVGNGT